MKRKIIVGGLLAILLGIGCAQEVSANANHFTFKFSYAVVGHTSYSLSAKNTRTNNIAQTYRYNTNQIVDNNGHYIVSLDGNGFLKKDYVGTSRPADGSYHYQKYGKIKKNTYTINVGTPDDLTASGREIQGEGAIETY